ELPRRSCEARGRRQVFERVECVIQFPRSNRIEPPAGIPSRHRFTKLGESAREPSIAIGSFPFVLRRMPRRDESANERAGRAWQHALFVQANALCVDEAREKIALARSRCIVR